MLYFLALFILLIVSITLGYYALCIGIGLATVKKATTWERLELIHENFGAFWIVLSLVFFGLGFGLLYFSGFLTKLL